MSHQYSSRTSSLFAHGTLDPLLAVFAMAFSTGCGEDDLMRDKQFKGGGTISWQAHEIDYVQKQVKKELPGKRVQQLQSAVDQCKRYIQPSEGREKLLACVREKLQ